MMHSLGTEKTVNEEPDARACRSHLMIKLAVSILERSARGREVGRQVYKLLASRLWSLDMDSKLAVLALLEEFINNRSVSVVEALADAFAEHPHNLDSPRSECAR